MKNLMMFSLMMFASIFAFAQESSKNFDSRIQKKVDRMTSTLNLTADQQTKVTGILTNYYENRNTKVTKGQELSKEERASLKAERKASRESLDAEIASVLTAEQAEIYKSHAKEGKGKGKKKGKGHGKKMNKGDKKTPAEKAEKKVAKLTEELNLTPTQQEQLMELFSSQAPKQSYNKEDMTKEERAAFKAERKAEKEVHKAKFEEILTAEQLATFNELKAERKKTRKGKKKEKNAENSELKKLRTIEN